MFSEADHYAVFPLTFINEVSVILHIHTSKHYYVHDIIMMRKTRHLSNDIHQIYVCSIIPTHSEPTPTEIHHLYVYSRAIHHVHSTIGIRWSLWEDALLGLSLGNNSFFYGQTSITTSVREPMWEEEAQKKTSCISKVIRQVSHFFKTFRTQLYSNSQEDIAVQKRDNCVFY